MRTDELRSYAAASLARKLRDFSDNDLCWIGYLSPPNLALVCRHFGTTKDVLLLAQSYEMRRRRASPTPRARAA